MSILPQSINILLEPRDFRVGVYWTMDRSPWMTTNSRHDLDDLVTLRIYLCMLPMVSILFVWRWWKAP